MNLCSVSKNRFGAMKGENREGHSPKGRPKKRQRLRGVNVRSCSEWLQQKTLSTNQAEVRLSKVSVVVSSGKISCVSFGVWVLS